MSVERKKVAAKLKIGDVAERLGTTTRTLRFYEEEGLTKPFRSGKGTRLYTEEDVERFEAIKSLTRAGFPLLEIKHLVRARLESKTGNESSRKVSNQLGEFLDDVEEKIRGYTQLKKQIVQADALVRKCFGCRKRPIRDTCNECPIGQQLENSQLLYLIWDET